MMEEGDVEPPEDPFIYRLNDNGCGPSLLIKVCAERGWRPYAYSGGCDERWNLWWRTSAFPANQHRTLASWQFMNHIPKGGSICRKDNLSRLLRCMRKIYGPVYDISPPGYHMPLEYAKLVAECSKLSRADDTEAAKAIWIHKPVAQSQGRGIFLFRSLCDLRCGNAAVVQRYIERPLLIAGYKFDLRLYVCVPSYRPLVVYMYAEGLARFGTDKYTLTDLHNPYRHLTNSSLNKSGPRYSECKDRIGNGCKWTLRQVRRQLRARCAWSAEWLAWQRVHALVVLTLLAHAAGTPPATNCFEFYGFDVLLDEDLKPWLLEVNLSPALAADCEADVLVKRPMLHELFDLLRLPARSTGLAQLDGPLPAHAPQSDSDDECGAGGGNAAPAPAPVQHRRGRAHSGRGRGRRRCSLAVHRVTLRPPLPAAPLKDTMDSRKELPNQRTPTEDDPENYIEMVGGEVSMTEEGVRKRGGGAGCGAGCSARAAWGNGLQWERAPAREGLWVRLYPHQPHHTRAHHCTANEEVREGVAAVSRVLRAAREVARESGEAREGGGARAGAGDSSHDHDTQLELALKRRLQLPSLQVWLPPSA